MLTKNWSFKNNEKCEEGKAYSVIQITLFNRLITSKRYINIANNLNLEIFLKSKFEVIIGRTKKNKRYLLFVWFDLLDEEVEIKIDLNENLNSEFSLLHDSIISEQRHSSNVIHSDPHYRSRCDPNYNLYARI